MSSEQITYVCPACEWAGEQPKTADDGADYPYVCPLCGCADLIEESDEVG